MRVAAKFSWFVRVKHIPAALRMYVKHFLGKLQYQWVARRAGDFDATWSWEDLHARVPDERRRYRYFLWFYATQLPEDLKRHRRYFADTGRGFGEDAFHAMWWKLIDAFSPATLLEIGVFRGQVISLWSMIGRSTGRQLEVWGVGPLSEAADSVSTYQAGLDYRSDIAGSFVRFGLGAPRLMQGLSQDAEAKAFILSRQWDMVYLDGSHDFSDVQCDVALLRDAMSPGSILVMDDASLYSGYSPYLFGFRGHPGPSQVAASQREMHGFRFVGSCGHNRVFLRASS